MLIQNRCSTVASAAALNITRSYVLARGASFAPWSATDTVTTCIVDIPLLWRRIFVVVHLLRVEGTLPIGTPSVGNRTK